MKRLLLLPALAILCAPAPANAFLHINPSLEDVVCGVFDLSCSKPKRPNVNPRIYKELAKDYKKSAPKKPARTVQDSRVK